MGGNGQASATVGVCCGDERLHRERVARRMGVGWSGYLALACSCARGAKYRDQRAKGVRLVNGGACGDAGMGGTGADAQPKCVCVCDGSDGALMWRVNGCVPEWAGAGAAQQVACQSGGGLALGCLLAGLVAARPGASTVAGPCLAVCLSVPQPQNPPTPSL